MAIDLSNEQEISMYLRDKIRTFEMTPGYEFPDVTSLLMDPEAFQISIDALAHRYANKQITHIVSCESRGFIFGAPLALALKVPFVPVRRGRRLPGKTIGVDYTSGFYTGRLEMHEDAITKGARVVIIDDLVATGNTLKVTCELIQKLEGEVIECGCIVSTIRHKESLQKIPVFGLVTI